MATKLPNSVIATTYFQSPDGVQGGFKYQELKLFTEGFHPNERFFVMQTKRWAFNSVDELIAILNDFKKRSSQGKPY